MTEIIEETITSQSSSAGTVAASPARTPATSSQTVEYLVYFLFGALEILLAFRLVLKLAGASTSSAFVVAVAGSLLVLLIIAD